MTTFITHVSPKCSFYAEFTLFIFENSPKQCCQAKTRTIWNPFHDRGNTDEIMNSWFYEIVNLRFYEDVKVWSNEFSEFKTFWILRFFEFLDFLNFLNFWIFGNFEFFEFLNLKESCEGILKDESMILWNCEFMILWRCEALK